MMNLVQLRATNRLHKQILKSKTGNIEKIAIKKALLTKSVQVRATLASLGLRDGCSRIHHLVDLCAASRMHSKFLKSNLVFIEKIAIKKALLTKTVQVRGPLATLGCKGK